MPTRRLKLEQALDLLPELEELEPLRDALIELSHPDVSQAWAGSQEYLTLEMRVVEPRAVEARAAEVAERVRERVERLYRHVGAALAAVERKDWVRAAEAMVAAGDLEASAGRAEPAERLYQKAVELGRKPRDRRVEGVALRRLGRTAWTQGRLEVALKRYRDAYAVAEAQRDAEGLVVACRGVGNVFVDQGRWSEAREWYLRAVEWLPEGAWEHFLHLCNSLSVVERRLGDLQASEAWLARGEERLAEAGDSSARDYLEHGRARLHLARREWVEAEACFRRILDREPDPVARVSALLNLSEPVLEQGRLVEAEAIIRSAEEHAIRHRVVRYLPYAYRALGELARRRRDPEGFVFFEQALSVVREHRLPVSEEATTLLEYARFEVSLGHRDSAAARLRLALSGFRSIGAAVEAAQVEEELNRLETDTAPDSGAPPRE